MGHSAVIALEERDNTIELAILDDDIASILTALEAEPIPEQLARLAYKLQQALVARSHRRKPS